MVLCLLIITGTLASALLPLVPADLDDNGIINDTVSYPVPTLTTVGKYTMVKMEGLDVMDEYGSPMLPVEIRSYAIPQGYELSQVTVIPLDETFLPGSYDVLPAEAYWPFSVEDTLPETPWEDPVVYGAGVVFPAEDHSVEGISTLGGVDVLTIRLHPVRYHAESQMISYYEGMNVIIELVESGETRSDGNGGLRDHHRSELETLVSNPTSLDSYHSHHATRAGDVDYLIITSNSLRSTFQRLADHREDKGLSTEILTVESITGTYSGKDTQEKIRNAIKNRYQENGLRYVVLGGDVDVVPARGMRTQVGAYVENSNPGDVYYGGLDGNWNSDNDGYWGEAYEGDHLQEVAVGRIPASTAAEANRYINKVIQYENEPNVEYLNQNLYAAQLLDSSSDYAVETEKEIRINPSGIQPIKQYENARTASRSSFTREINDGVHIISHGGHANAALFTLAYTTYREYYTISDVNGLRNTDTPFMMLTVGCTLAAFDKYDSIGESLVTSENAAYAVVANARYGWYYRGAADRASAEYNYEFFKNFYTRDNPVIGTSYMMTMNNFATRANAGGLYGWISTTWNLLGDPAIEAYNGGPVSGPDLKVTSTSVSPNEPSSGQETTITTTVKNTGIEPAPATVVQVRSNDGLSTTLPVQGLAVGAQQTVEITWIPTATGSQPVARTITVTADHGNDAQELDETNNVRTTSVTVIPNQAPTARITGDSLLSSGVTVIFSGSTSNDPNDEITGYTWDLGDGVTTHGVSTSHIYSRSGTYEVTLTVEDSYGASDSTTLQVYVDWRPPVANAGEDVTKPTYAGVTFNGLDSDDLDGDIVDYTWYVADETVLHGHSPTHSFTDDGTYVVRLVVTDTNGLTDDDSMTVTVTNRAPSSVISSPHHEGEPSSSPVYATRPIIFDGSSSSDLDGDVVRYSWDFGDGTTAMGTEKIHTYSSPDIYTVTLTVTDDDGTPSSTTRELNVRNNPPVAEAGNDREVLSGTTVRFDASASTDRDGTITSYVWAFGDGSSSNSKSTSHLYTKNGEFNVKLTVKDNAGATGTDFVKVTVKNRLPIARFSLPSSVYKMETVELDGSGSVDADGTIKSYSWDMGDDTLLSGVNAEHTYTEKGTYTVTLVVTDNDGGTAERTAKIVVNNRPPMSIAGPSQYAFVGTSVTFDAARSYDVDSSDDLTYHWSFGDGASSVRSRTTHTFNRPGSYTVILKVTDADGDSATSSQKLIIKPWSDPSWALVNVSSGTATPVNLAFCANATATDGFDPDYDIPLPPLPPGGAPLDAYIHSADPAFPRLFKDTRHIEPVMQWDITVKGDRMITMDWTTFLPRTHNKAYLTIAGSTYDISETPVVTIPRGTFSGTVKVLQELEARISIEPGTTVRSQEPITLQSHDSVIPDGKTATHSWKVIDTDGSILTSKEGSMIVKPAAPGTIRATLTMAVGGITDVKTVTIVVENRAPTLEVARSLGVALNTPTEFTMTASDADGSIVAYRWDFDTSDGITEQRKGAKVSYTYTTPGRYTLRAWVVDDSGAESFKEARVTVTNAAPAVTITVPEPWLSNSAGNIRVSVVDTDSDFELSDLEVHVDGELASSGLTKVLHSFKTSGHHTVSATITDEFGARTHTTLDVDIVNRDPVARIPPSISGRAGTPITFAVSDSSDPDGSITGYTIDMGDGTTRTFKADGGEPTYTYATKGNFVAWVTAEDNNGGSDIAKVLVSVVNAPPVAEAGNDIRVVSGETVILDGSGSTDDEGIVSWSWDFDASNGHQSQAKKAVTTTKYSTPGSYRVVLKVTDREGQSSTDELTVTVDNAPPQVSIRGTVSLRSLTQGSYTASVVDMDGKVTSLNWDVEGETYTGTSIKHTFRTPGTKTVTVSALDNDGAQGVGKFTVTVSNRAPTMNLNAELKGRTNTPIPFAATAFDEDGSIRSISWSFGDGEKGSGAQVTHSYDDDGVYLVTATATDDSGASVSRKATVRVSNQGPLVEVDDLEVIAGERFVIEPTTMEDTDGDVTAATWRLDGETYTGNTPRVSVSEDGSYTATVTVKDDDGAVTTETFRVTATNMKMVIELYAGWNLVSVPLVPEDASVSAVFGNDVKVYHWNSHSRAYNRVTSVEVGESYFVSVRDDRTIEVEGAMTYGYQKDLVRGWNAIGSTTDTFTLEDVDTDIATGQVYVYHFDAVLKSYILVETIEPGMGAFVAAYDSGSWTVDTDDVE